MGWKLKDYEAAAPKKGFKAIYGRQEWKDILIGCVLGAQLQEETGFPKTLYFLLTGEQGVGKTILASSFAKEAGYRFFSLSMQDFMGETANDIRQNVEALREGILHETPAFLLIEDVDSYDAFEVAAPLAQVLAELKEKDNLLICVMTAQNEQEVPYLLRDMSTVCRLKNPSRDERKAYFKKTVGTIVKCRDDFGFEQMADKTEGFSFGDCRDIAQFLQAILIQRGMHDYGSLAVGLQAVKRGDLRLDEELFDRIMTLTGK